MSRTRPRILPSRAILLSTAGLVALSLFVYAVLWIIDFAGVEGGGVLALWEQTEARNTLTGLGEVTVGILGAALTVVAIIVELSAHRYTPRVTELFVRDPVNIVSLSFFVVTAVLVLWSSMSVYGPAHPKAMVLVSIGFMSVSLLILLPYFTYVFEFLQPTKVVSQIQQKAVVALRLGKKATPAQLEHAKREVGGAVEQLGDMVLNSIDNKDKAIAIASINALAGIAETSLQAKADQASAWFDSDMLTDGDRDFIAFHRGLVRQLTERQTWLEMKILRQYQAAFNNALGPLPDINHLLAIQTRHMAVYASVTNDLHTLGLGMKFLNTYLRAAINERNVRSAYNLMGEYRLLGESLVVRGYDPIAVEVANHMKFYGQLAFNQKLAFILESAAYDLCTLLESAHKNRSAAHDSLLEIFLDVDREPEGGRAQETALRGVRKAQVKLATHYLVRDDYRYALRIWEDMSEEVPDRLDSIRAELMSLETEEYWEVNDRGTNFDYLPPDRREKLNEFFGWFDYGPPGSLAKSRPGKSHAASGGTS